MKKKIILPVIGLAVLGSVLFGVTKVNAQTNNQTPLSGLVQMISQKFGLDQKQVQSVVDQYSQQRKADRQQKMQQGIQNRLDNAVKQRKITDAQKQAILNEITVLKNKYNPASFKNMTPEQKKQAIQNERADIQAFAKSQNINPSYLGFGFGMMRGRRWSNVTPTP